MLFISGYVEDDAGDNCCRPAVGRFLPKPFTPDELRVLDAASTTSLSDAAAQGSNR